MPAVTIRNHSDETHRALKAPAARPEGRPRLGSALAEMSRRTGLTNADVEALEAARDARPADPLRFE